MVSVCAQERTSKLARLLECGRVGGAVLGESDAVSVYAQERTSKLSRACLSGRVGVPVLEESDAVSVCAQEGPVNYRVLV